MESKVINYQKTLLIHLAFGCRRFSFCQVTSAKLKLDSAASFRSVCTLIHGIPCICGGRSKIVTGRFLLTKMSQRMCLENLSPYLWVF